MKAINSAAAQLPKAESHRRRHRHRPGSGVFVQCPGITVYLFMLATFPLTWAIKNYTRKAAKQGNKRTDQFLMLNQLKTSKRKRQSEC